MFFASTHTNYLDYVFKEPPNCRFGEPLIVIILRIEVKQVFPKNCLSQSDGLPSGEAENFDRLDHRKSPAIKQKSVENPTLPFSARDPFQVARRRIIRIPPLGVK